MNRVARGKSGSTVAANHAFPWVGSESTDVASASVNESDPGDVSVASV